MVFIINYTARERKIVIHLSLSQVKKAFHHRKYQIRSRESISVTRHLTPVTDGLPTEFTQMCETNCNLRVTVPYRSSRTEVSDLAAKCSQKQGFCLSVPCFFLRRGTGFVIRSDCASRLCSQRWLHLLLMFRLRVSGLFEGCTSH